MLSFVSFLMIVFIAFIFIMAVMILLFEVLLPNYKLRTAQTDFGELIQILNIIINTELELWKSDLFIGNKGIANNSQYENFYHEICNQIITSISDIYFENIERYVTKESVISMIGRRVKKFLNEYVQEPMNDPSVGILFKENRDGLYR